MTRGVSLLSIPGRWLAPLLLVVFAFAATGVNFAVHWREVGAQVSEQETRRLRERLGVEQSRLSTEVGTDNALRLRRLVGSLGIYSGMLHAVVIGADGRIQASLMRSDIGRPFAELQVERAELADIRAALAAPGNGASIQVAHPPGARYLIGRATFDNDRRLLTVVDLRPSLAARHAGLWRQLWRDALVSLVLSGLLAALLHWTWFRRAEQLARALAAMGEGRLETRTGLEGRDELALIGAQADRMAGQLQIGLLQLQHMIDLVDRSPVVVIEWRNAPGWPMSYLSRSVAQWGYRPEQLLDGQVQYNELVHPDDVGRVNEEIAHYFAHGPDEYRQEYRLRCADGRWAWVDDRTTLTRDEDGAVAGISGVLLDITVWKLAEIERLEQGELLRPFYEMPFLGMAISDPISKRWLHINDRLCEILGYTREELMNKTWLDVSPEPERTRLLSLMQRMMAGEFDSYQLRRQYLRKDGSLLWAEMHGRALRAPDGSMHRLFVTVQDITERLQAEELLNEHRNQLARAEAMAGLGSWSYDSGTQTIWWSDQMYRNIGRDPALGPAPDLDAYLQCLHPQDRDMVAAHMRAVQPGTDAPGIEFRRHPALGEERWFRGTVQCRRPVGDGHYQYTGTVLDITPLRQAQTELERINAALELRVAERTRQLSEANQELEAFSYTVSHDLKAPLRGIDGYSQLLEEEYAGRIDEEGRQYIGRIRRGVQQMGALIADLLDYSRMERRTMEHQPVELLPLVGHVIEGHGADIDAARTELCLQVEPMTLSIDREGLAVVLRNLLGNAIKFSQGSPQPRVEIGARCDDGRRILWVRDNGVGFDMKYHDRIFGIFQRLQRAEDYTGTGVGLALVAKAVHRMGGRVWAESAPGQGATFFLEFPL
jgi:PAS domain S-box-containing protein